MNTLALFTEITEYKVNNKRVDACICFFYVAMELQGSFDLGLKGQPLGCDGGKGGWMIKVARVPSFLFMKDTKSGRVNFIIS